MNYDVVVPTLRRPSLAELLRAIGEGGGPLPGRVLIVDDRAGRSGPPPVLAPAQLADRVRVLPAPGRGPATARNLGWRASNAPWIVFLDDDVVPESDWAVRLERDLVDLPPLVAGSQGRIDVPMPTGRRPTDWERNVEGLRRARWATADMAYRRPVLEELGGFDERFRRAYREDADLGLRVLRAGYGIERGSRRILHPIRREGVWVSVRLQAGNADDVLMRALHGRGWREAADAPRGILARHLATTAAGALALGGLLTRRRGLALAGAAGWLTVTAELAWSRIVPGPRTRREIATMLVTSAALPAAATIHTLRGLARLPWLLLGPRTGARTPLGPPAARPAAVLFDRDGTLVDDVPYNGDPSRVRPVPGARAALERLREEGIPTAVISNQSGVGRGLLTEADVGAVNQRVEEALGPLGPWLVCPHSPADRCACRKPSPGLVVRAASALGVDPSRCAVIGDTAADIEAATAAGARGILVPNRVTRPEEIARAPEIASDIESAVARLVEPE